MSLDSLFAEIRAAHMGAESLSDPRPEWANVATTYVKGVRGGMQAAPVVRHAMKQVLDPRFHSRRERDCAHNPPCETVFIPKCHDAESCGKECGPVNMDEWTYGRVNPVTGLREGGRDGVVSKGTVSPGVRPAKPGTFAKGDNRDNARSFQGRTEVSQHVYARKAECGRLRPIQERKGALLLIAFCTPLAAFMLSILGGIAGGR